MSHFLRHRNTYKVFTSLVFLRSHISYGAPYLISLAGRAAITLFFSLHYKGASSCFLAWMGTSEGITFSSLEGHLVTVPFSIGRVAMGTL